MKYHVVSGAVRSGDGSPRGRVRWRRASGRWVVGRVRTRALPSMVGILVSFATALVAIFGLLLWRPMWFTPLRNYASFGRDSALGMGSPAPKRIGNGASPRVALRTGAQRHRSNHVASPAGTARITSVDPRSGAPGESIEVSGSRLMSADGHVVAEFDSQTAPTSCPSADRCVVVVPPNPARGTSVLLRIETSTGLSNAVEFRYAA